MVRNKCNYATIESDVYIGILEHGDTCNILSLMISY